MPRPASVEGVQSKRQRVVRFALKHMRGDATKGRGLSRTKSQFMLGGRFSGSCAALSDVVATINMTPATTK